eukprot:GFUD01034902.1.p1 GENE.GFUD01034902.1~~GFUD01034902.1.p1  ORF type:complete len:100 (+),score=31.42 GFUD01034902.1:69-368(+)
MDETDCEATGSCGPSPADSAPEEEEYEATLGQQTVLAIQQLSVIVGVALLVGSGFMLMIALENLIDKLEEKCKKLMGQQKETEEDVDPAALVGSFKRYK